MSTIPMAPAEAKERMDAFFLLWKKVVLPLEA